MECKALPSEVAAVNVFRGEKYAVSEAIHYTAWRALAIGLQLHALGVKSEDLIRYSALASLGVELNVLTWAYETVKRYPDLKFDKELNPSTCIPFGPERAASNLVRGKWSEFFPVVYHTFIRSFFIAAGLYAAGERQNLAKYSLITSAGVQVGILSWLYKQVMIED